MPAILALAVGSLMGASALSWFRGFLWTTEHYPPGTDTGQEMIAHYGEEAGVVLEGEIELTVGSSVKQLGPGESYYFKTNIPHRFRNTGDTDCKIVSCATPGKAF